MVEYHVAARTAADTDDPMAGVIRNLITGMPDDAIRGIVEGVVKGLAEGVVEVLTDRIVEHLAELGATEEPPPPAEVVETDGPGATVRVHVPEPPRTCEVCGRVGQRRFEKTATGWRCSATANCGGRHPSPKVKVKTTPPTPAAPAKAEPPAGPKPWPYGVTARCKDCTRSWNLSGRVLQHAIDLHELQHSHIVEVKR